MGERVRQDEVGAPARPPDGVGATPDARSADGLQARVEEVAARLNAAHAELVALTAEAISADVWAGGGVRSVEHWLVLRAGLSPARARDIALLARRSVELPATMSSLGKAELSVDQAVVVARHTPAAFDASVRDFAVFATVPQLRAVLPRYVFEDEPPAAEGHPSVPDPAAPAELFMGFEDGGRFRLVFTAAADLGALVDRAVREAKDSLFSAGQSTSTLADGFVEVAERSLRSIDGTPRANRFRVYLHVDTGRFTAASRRDVGVTVAPVGAGNQSDRNELPRGRGWVNRGPVLPPSLVDLHTCDGLVRPIWEADGVPVSVGRAQRIVPARTRRLVEDRDRGCRFPGCAATGFLENHHLDHWRDGGQTVLDRLVSLCPYHHRQHHLGAFAIEGTPVRSFGIPDGLVFRDRFGAVLGARPPTPTPTQPEPEPPGHQGGVATARYAGPTGEPLQPAWIWFAPSG